MLVQSTQPVAILQRIRELAAPALELEPERVYLAPDPSVLGRLPPAAERFAAVVLQSVRFEQGPQHPAVWPALLDLQTCIYSRVAVDRPVDMTALLTDPDRGLLPLADRLLAALAGHELPLTPPEEGRLLRGPLVCTGLHPVRWAESGNVVVAFVALSWIAPFEYGAV
jgi:hypothetical protein